MQVYVYVGESYGFILSNCQGCGAKKAEVKCCTGACFFNVILYVLFNTDWKTENSFHLWHFLVFSGASYFAKEKRFLLLEAMAYNVGASLSPSRSHSQPADWLLHGDAILPAPKPALPWVMKAIFSSLGSCLQCIFYIFSLISPSSLVTLHILAKGTRVFVGGKDC